jgi:hypothetical protein
VDSRCPGWAKLLLLALRDATSPDEAEAFVAGALDAAVSCGAREEREATLATFERWGSSGWEEALGEVRRGEHVPDAGDG